MQDFEFEKSEKPYISVILPVYNVENYIEECLKSIVGQTLENIEIICVNDGSTDGSKEIIEDFANKDKRIKLISQENQGQGVARNRGIEAATGEYISFVDPDDWIEPDTFEICYENLKNTGADVVLFDFATCKDNGEFSEIQTVKHKAEKNLKIKLKPNDIFKWSDFKKQTLTALTRCVWDKIYSAKLIKDNNIRLAESKLGEDHIFSIGASLLANKILYLNKPFYHYRTRNGSSVNKASDDGFCVFENVKLLKQFLLEHNLFEEYEKAYYNYKIEAYALHYVNIKKESLKRYLEQCKSYLSEDDYAKFLKAIKPKFNFLEKIFCVKNKKIQGKKVKFINLLGVQFVVNKAGDL